MLNFPPGSEYLYSNTGYALAGLIVQRVSGKTLDQFTQERLFKPLGMTSTQWRDDFTKVVAHRATAYSGSEAGGFHTDMPFTNMVGNGGLLSTMSDLLKWNENLDHPAVGGPAYVDAMETRMRLGNGRTITYALGLEVGDYDGVRQVAHGGSTAGYRTYLARYPEQHVSVAVWCNYAGANATALSNEVVDLVLAKPPRAPARALAPVVRMTAAELARWAAVYRDPHTDQTVTLTANDSLLTSGGGRGGLTLAPLGGAHFRSNQNEVVFAGTAGRRRFDLIRDDDTTRYEEVRPAPATIPVQEYVGTYASDELDVRLDIVARDARLVVRRRPADEIELRPAYADDFQATGFGTLRFTRDAAGAVSGFAIYAGRVLDVRFKRVGRPLRQEG